MRVTQKGARMGDTRTHRRAASQSEAAQRGWYLLEYSVVLFGVAAFIVGFSDVSRIFHARGAVRAGVTEGLRCLYTTDAGCSDASLNNGWFPNDRFNARITGNQTNRFELPRVSYNLTSSWFNEPVSEASFVTKQLTAVTLSQPQDAYRQYQVLFPGTAHAVYLLKTQELPRVARGLAGTAAERVLNPRFFDSETGAQRAPNDEFEVGNLSFNAASVSAGRTGAELERSFTISLGDVFPNAAAWTEVQRLQAAHGFTAACYQGPRTTLPTGAPGVVWPLTGPPARCAYRSDPTALYDGRGLRVPIMIHVTGDGYITPNAAWPEWRGVFAQVELELWQNGEKLAELGGREFSRSSQSTRKEFDKQWGNFVVRGAGFTDRDNIDVTEGYREACEEAGYSVDKITKEPRECRKYITMPLIAVDQPVTLKFRLIWRGEGAKPRPNVDLSWQNGQVRIFHPTFQATHEQRPCGHSEFPNSCGASVAPMQVSFRTTDLEQGFSHTSRPETTCDRVNPPGYQASIPEALEGFRSEIRSGARPLQPIAFWSSGASGDQCSPRVSEAPCSEAPREYMKGCEPEYSLASEAPSLCTLADYQPIRDTLSQPRFTYRDSERLEVRGGCTGEPFPECARGQLKSKSNAFLGAVSNGCAAALPVNVTPFHSGALFKNTCVDELAGFVEKYREKHQIPAPIGVGVLERTEPAVIARQEPTGGCVEYQPITDQPGQSWLCAEQASYAVANTCCKTYGDTDCSIEPVRVGDGGGQDGGVTQIVEGARQRAFTTVQAAYPPATMDLTCGQTAEGEPSANDCLTIQAGPADNGRRARVQAAMRVPLALFDWFGMKNYTVVQYEETRALESALVGEAS